jgi:glyoxylate reductase
VVLDRKVLVSGAVPDAGINKLSAAGLQVDQVFDLTRDGLLRRIPQYPALLSLLSDRVDREVIAAAPQLKIIANYAVGYNNIDLDAASEHNVFVTNTPGVLTDATADLAMTLMLGVARRVVEGDRMVREGRFTGWGPQLLLGIELRGKVLGIIGAGRIGFATARRAQAFGMKIVYTSRSVNEEFEHMLDAQKVELDSLLQQSDFVSLHVPLTPETKYLLDRTRLEMMKPSACLINTARGPVVDEAALVQLLREKRLAGAGFDVYEHEPDLAPGLAELENTVLLPHLGSATVETRDRMAEMAAENIIACLNGEVPPNALNDPFC